MNFFISDPHFSSKRVFDTYHRPFKDVNDYDKKVIKIWNKQAKKTDTIYIVGDLFSCCDKQDKTYLKVLKLIKKIKANVVLIMGNNEDKIIKYHLNGDKKHFEKMCLEAGIKSIHRALKVKVGNTTVNLVHQIKDGNKRMLNLYGHLHLCGGQYHPYGICVSADLNHFRLHDEDYILELIDRKKHFWNGDENLNYINPYIKLIDGEYVNIHSKEMIYSAYNL